MQTVKRAYTNHNTGFLGILAVVCMVTDHVGAIFFPGVLWLRVVGRIAFPLFAWGIAIGAEHTRSFARYALRLLLLLVISQPFYMLALNHPITKLNIFAVLLLGLAAIWGLKEKREWMTVGALLIAAMVPMDYGFRGVLCIVLLWALRDTPSALAVCFALFCVLWGEGGTPVWRTPYFTVRLQTAAALALPLMLWPTSKRLRMPRWLMYAMYPGHLAVLWILKDYL